MVTIRPAEVTDLLEMQHCNLFNLPENYNLRYWLFHMASHPRLPQVAVDERTGKVVGYVLGKLEDQDATDKEMESGKKFPHGHITSISVLRDYRKLGIATKLMRACHMAMKEVYGAKYVSLHVRVTNRAAYTLYADVLGYEICDVSVEYYADKEDAYDMKLFFDKKVRSVVLKKKPLNAEESKDEPAGADGKATTSCQTDTPASTDADASASAASATTEP